MQNSPVRAGGKVKITSQKSKLLVLIVLIVAIVFWFVSQRRSKSIIEQPLVRDEFVDKLVDTAEQPYPLLVQGRTYYEQGEYERAKKLFKKATQLDRQYRDAFYHLGITELVLGNTDKSYYALLRAKTIDPIYKPTIESLIIVYEKRGDVAKAAELQDILPRL